MIKILSLSLLLSSLCIAGEIALFQPPKGWEYAQLKNKSPYTKVGFIGKGSNSFHPSINLAIEEIETNDKEYIQAVKKVHLAESQTTWRDLGKFSTKAGTARLTEITKKLSFGEIKILQLIFVKKEKAYLLTAAASKTDYLKEQSHLFESFRSFTLSQDLLAPLSCEEKIVFQEIFTQVLPYIEEKEMKKVVETKDWQQFQAQVSLHSQMLGKYWEILMLQEGLEKLPLLRNENGIKH